MIESFDPSAAEAIVTMVLALLAGGTGYGMKRGRREAAAEHMTEQLTTLTEQLGTLAAQQAETTRELASIATTLNRFVDQDLKSLDRGQRRLAADVDTISDTLELLTSHIEIPAGARETITGKLMRHHRHELTGATLAAGR